MNKTTFFYLISTHGTHDSGDTLVIVKVGDLTDLFEVVTMFFIGIQSHWGDQVSHLPLHGLLYCKNNVNTLV